MSQSTVDPDLVARIQEAIGELEKEGGGGAHAAALLRCTRQALDDLRESDPPSLGTRTLLHRVLIAASKRPVRLAFHASPFAAEWTDLILEVVEEADFTCGDLFFDRARELGDRTLFLPAPDSRVERISWADAEARVLEIGRALLGLREREPVTPVALLGLNSPELALFDLACLITGTPNVPIPANSPPGQIAYILEHSLTRSLFLGDDLLADSVADALEKETSVSRVHWLDPAREAREGIASFADFLAAGDDVPESRVRETSAAVRSSDHATTMYTSGTTGLPKGVPFTQGNLVTKRFARAAAWPDLGEGDVFLCYLPLYHTFGRWLEMLGCVFWGSVYAFVEDVSVESLLYSFQRVRPTTFISVPKKWLQIAETVAPADAEPPSEREAEEELSERLREATGGRLRRGLSAAGYLPVPIFRRFHRAGIELHSGFGMTEATGGITMTPAGEYRDDSIGVALPGIELKIADDGELLIRGPYVTAETPDDPPREDDWFATGDIVEEDREGHLKIVDRKKEIFKNLQGETISPRRVESLFTDFEIVERILVIGDRRDYCTALIVPSADLREDFAGDRTGETLDSPELRELFSPVVATVNRFLAPFERILDFAVLARDLEPGRELTAKGTPRRKLVAEAFADVIEPMYSRDQVSRTVGSLTVHLPHWLLRQTGIPSGELQAGEDTLEVPARGKSLVIRPLEDGLVRVGDCDYDPGGDDVLLGEILGRAELWLGNEAAHRFAGRDIEHWWRRGRRFQIRTRLAGRPILEDEPPPEPPSGTSPELDVAGLHRCARQLAAASVDDRRRAVRELRAGIRGERSEMETLVREVLISALADVDIRAESLEALIPGLTPEELDDLMGERLDDPTFLTEEERRVVARRPLRSDQLEALLARARRLLAEGTEGWERFLSYLSEQAIGHRASHRAVRSLFVRLGDDHPELRESLDALISDLVRRFRERLPALRTAEGVSWEEAIVIEGDVAGDHRERLLRSLRETRLLPEAMALFGPDPEEVLEPLGPGTVRVSFLGTGTGRAVYYLSWAPQGVGPDLPRFECVIKLNTDLPWVEVQRELRLLVRARAGASGRPVVKTAGGGFEKTGAWTEEFIPGRTLDEMIDELAQEEPLPGSPGGGGRLPEIWQFVVSASAALMVEFWNRTGRVTTLENPTPIKVVLPEHDWQIGGRLVSIADRVHCTRLIDVLSSIHERIVRPLRERYASTDLGPAWPLLLAAALEVLGEEAGAQRLQAEIADETDRERSMAVRRFLSSIRRRGYMPMRIRAAARRYRRWAQLNEKATVEAQASTLDQLAEAYGVGELEAERPGTRLQLFRHTVFRGAEPEFIRPFDEIVTRTLNESLSQRRWHREIGKLRKTLVPSDRDEFFLARLLYPHVSPEDHAFLTRETDVESLASGVEVEHRDSAGEVFHVRYPRNPNEVSALYRVFRAANFRSLPTVARDDLLVAISETGRVIGGIIFHRVSESYVRLEWIVVSRHRRQRGIGGILISDFLERMKAHGVRVVSTGFFRPSFFSNHGFGVDPRYAGLVRTLEAESPEAPAAGRE